MLEKQCIQSIGFRSVVSKGEITGFQFNIRSLYYRGIWLSQLRQSTITVDGETFSKEQITWTINGVTYKQEEMLTLGDVFWGLLEPATLTVIKEGGLNPGAHDIELKYEYSSSYFPPSMDTMLSSAPHRRSLILVQ